MIWLLVIAAVLAAIWLAWEVLAKIDDARKWEDWGEEERK